MFTVAVSPNLPQIEACEQICFGDLYEVRLEGTAMGSGVKTTRAIVAPRAIVTTRAIVALSLAVLIVVGPAYRHVFAGREAYFPRWSMFSGIATGFIAARFELQTKEGERRVIPWREVWPSPENEKGPLRAQRLTHERELKSLILRVCRAQSSEGVLHVHAKVADRRGWKTIWDGTEDVCAQVHQRRSRAR